MNINHRIAALQKINSATANEREWCIYYLKLAHKGSQEARENLRDILKNAIGLTNDESLIISEFRKGDY